MRLTRFSDLGLRVMLYLTYQKRANLVTVGELSERFEWSRNHIVKAVHFLSRQGWIISQRGRSGGLMLAKEPSAYKIGELLRVLEGCEPLIECENPSCTMGHGCRIRVALAEAQHAFFEKLNEYTLDDLASTPEVQATIIRLNEMHTQRLTTTSMCRRI